MKKRKTLLNMAACLVAAVCGVGFSACAGKSVLLAKPQAAAPLSYAERRDADLAEIYEGAEKFAARFSQAVYGAYAGEDNFALSPVSVYMGLSLAAECAAGETREEILSALGVSYEGLNAQFSNFYRSLTAVYKDDLGKTTGRLDLGNSIWVNRGTAVKDACVQTLAEKYHCYSYSADFAGDNKNANLAVRNFVKKQTNKLIDCDFNLPQETLFTLVNTLYLKDVWNMFGEDLPYAEGQYAFTQKNGESKETKLLQSDYLSGRAYETESFTHFYAKTYRGYRIAFLLPKEGYTTEDIFTAENLSAVNALKDYNAYDDENMLHYYTRCLFPEFSASFNGNIAQTLRSAFGLDAMFDASVCDFSALTDDVAVCGEVRHVTQLKVTKKGIEGAAATVFPGAGAPGPDEYTEVYEDFIVDGAFGFTVSDSYGITLFSGVVNRV